MSVFVDGQLYEGWWMSNMHGDPWTIWYKVEIPVGKNNYIHALTQINNPLMKLMLEHKWREEHES